MKLVMFDMDGTLYRTETSFFPAVQEFATHHAFPVPDDQFLRSFIGKTGEYWRAWVEQLQLGQPIEELLQEFDLLERKLVEERGQLYPGVADVLRYLTENGWNMGICSNAPEWYPELILNRAGVRNLFDVVRVPHHPGETKSMMLCEVWNELHPEQCAMVGDRADDMRAAHAAGFLAIGAAYGWGPDELDQAEVQIHDITEVPAALAERASAVEEPAAASATEMAKSLTEVPAATISVEPAAVQSKPQPVPQEITKSVPPASEPARQQEPAPVARRSWNPFRRRDEKSR